MAERDEKDLGPGQPDYGHNNPTGGTDENTGKLNPQGPTSGTENFSHDRKRGEQTTAPLNGIPGAGGNLAASPVPANPGDIEDPRGDTTPGASATGGSGAGAPGDTHFFRCADAGFGDCRWETSSATSDDLMAQAITHAREQHGIQTLDEKTRGKLQDAIHVRRAA